ncbi:alpha/beta fold hydrolase [Bosea sp. TAF32]|uniref:alpha/beta fold hydrolase n=1 Tax=Bosea sp. TAF32 TaxID=3237482 RepID=UPI003F90D466
MPVVFVHGNLSTHETWRHVLAAMPSDLRAVAYDLRGHSASAKPFGNPSVPDFAADLDELRGQLDLPPMILVGQSFGAFVAAAYAAEFPEHVRGLLLIAAPAGRSVVELEQARNLVVRFRAEGVMAVMKTLVSAWYTDEFRERHPDAVDRRLDQIGRLDEDISIRTYELYNDFELGAIAGRLRCPTTVMTGEFARGCGAQAAVAFAQNIARSNVVIVPKLKNGIPTEAPGKIVSSIKHLVGDHSRT